MFVNMEAILYPGNKDLEQLSLQSFHKVVKHPNRGFLEHLQYGTLHTSTENRCL